MFFFVTQLSLSVSNQENYKLEIERIFENSKIVVELTLKEKFDIGNTYPLQVNTIRNKINF